jgi:3-phosphoshikimate 1-carboxyvinyltransferase
MTKKILKTNVKGLTGSIQVPGDKSISHRAVMFGSIAHGTTTVSNFLLGEDCLSTISCFQKLGVNIEQKGDQITIEGKGLDGLIEPTDILNVGNSGTTARLMLGILASAPFHSCVIGDESIAKRPMSRVTVPLRQMGAQIDGRKNGEFTPLSIRGGQLQPIEYRSPVASAQVKSAILLAGLHADGTTSVTEPYKSRDHTERMLKAFGAELHVDGLTISVKGKQQLIGTHIDVPGDISSAAFFLAAGTIVPDSHIVLENVGINPTRTGIIDVLKAMGANISLENVNDSAFEPTANITVSTSSLRGTEIGGELIPRLIDEIPIIALLATQAEGTTIIRDAKELKVKETNRIDTVVNELKKLGADIEATEDGMIIHGKTKLKGNIVNSYGDHRIGMMLSIAACIAEGEMLLENAQAIAVSYPSFFDHLDLLMN